MAKEILESWFAHVYEPNETNDTCLAQVADIEVYYLKSV